MTEKFTPADLAARVRPCGCDHESGDLCEQHLSLLPRETRRLYLVRRGGRGTQRGRGAQ